jgi:hypothetical protein
MLLLVRWQHMLLLHALRLLQKGEKGSHGG